MEKTRELKLIMFNNVINLCDAGLPTGTVAPFITAYGSFKSTTTLISITQTMIDNASNGLSVSKAQAKGILINSAISIAKKVSSYAVAINDNVLKATVNFSPSGLNKMNSSALSNACTTIHEKANGLATPLLPYGVSAADITALQTAIATFNTAAPKPRTAKSIIVAGNKTLTTLFSANMLLLTDTMVPLAQNWKVSASQSFYDTFISAKEIGKVAVYKTVWLINVVDDKTGAPLKSVKVVLDPATTAEVKHSTKIGNATYRPISAGNHTAKLTKKNYVTQTTPVTLILADNTNRLTVKLVAV